jgi:hypothetical protein
MARFRPFVSPLVGLASLALCLFAVASCGTDSHASRDGAIWFVHATDPHIYKDKIEKKDLNTVTDEDKKPKLQKLDEAALTALFQKVADLPQSYGPPAFLLITGDFGIDPCLITTPPLPPASASNANKDPKVCINTVDKDLRKAQIQNLAAILAKSPVSQIYFVAGNNDLPVESAAKESLDYFNSFFKDVQDELATTQKSKNELFNLTSCYADPKNPPSPCYQDVPRTSYRLIGFPSQSFKNRDGDAAGNKQSLDQEVEQVALFQRTVAQATSADKKVIVVTHIPELDDPYLLGLDKYGKEDALKDSGSRIDGSKPGVSAWNVNDKILADWKNAVASNSVIAVFAGHLHDSHQEAYRRPYSWSTQTDSRIALNKLYLAPPLSMKKQDNSVFQARGFSTITLFPDSIEQRLYWYDSTSKAFILDPLAESAHRHSGWFTHVLAVWRWFWNLDSNDGDLERTTVLLIALLAAFLTIIAVWQLPPSDSPLATKPGDKPISGADSKTDPSPFTTKLGKTVIGGVGGFVFTDIAKTLCSKELSDAAKCFYLVWFILFFFLLLLLSAVLRGLIEAIRSRVAVIHYPLARPQGPPRDSGGHEGGPGSLSGPRKPRPSTAARRLAQVWDWISYWSLRFTSWFYSLKVPLLTFSDTFFNLIQGKNQTTTRALAEVIVDQQKTLIRTVDAIRKNLNHLIDSKITRTEQDDTLPHVRVNISVLSADQSSVFYISTSPGSAVLDFPKHSVAWVSVFTGQIRWWCNAFRQQADKILLFDNSKGVIADAEDKLMLRSYYQDRAGDYGGFVIIPLPWSPRSHSKYVKGAIHISFREVRDIFDIWKQGTIDELPADSDNPNIFVYSTPERILADWCAPDDVRAALQNSVYALSELLFGFNEIIYKNYIHPDPQS